MLSPPHPPPVYPLTGPLPIPLSPTPSPKGCPHPLQTSILPVVSSLEGSVHLLSLRPKTLSHCPSKGFPINLFSLSTSPAGIQTERPLVTTSFYKCALLCSQYRASSSRTCAFKYNRQMISSTVLHLS